MSSKFTVQNPMEKVRRFSTRPAFIAKVGGLFDVSGDKPHARQQSVLFPLDVPAKFVNSTDVQKPVCLLAGADTGTPVVFLGLQVGGVTIGAVLNPLDEGTRDMMLEASHAGTFTYALWVVEEQEPSAPDHLLGSLDGDLFGEALAATEGKPFVSRETWLAAVAPSIRDFAKLQELSMATASGGASRLFVVTSEQPGW